MDTEINAVTAIALLNERFDDLLEMAGRVPMQAWDLPTSLPGWSVRDVFAHCAGGERAVMGDSSPNVEVAHLTHVKNAIGAFVEVWVESMRSLTIEELLAEMGAAFLSAHCGLPARLEHASYIDSWLDALRRDKRLIFVAAGAAQKAADYVLGETVSAPAPVIEAVPSEALAA